jgi:hypothetical protein
MIEDTNGGREEKEEQKMEQTPEILDRQAALAGVGGDLEFLSELLGIFRAASPTLLHDIRDALVKGDLPALAYAARLVRVTAQNVAARRVYAAATLLEETATCGELEGARRASSRLEEEMDKLKSALTTLAHAVGCSRC